MARRSFLGRWLRRLVLYVVFLALLAGGLLAGAYYSGVQIPIYSDVAAFALKNWNKTRDVEVEADYESVLARKGDRVHVTVELRLPATMQRVQDFLDGGRVLLVTCAEQKLYVHNLQSADLAVDGPVVSLAGRAEIELDGLLSIREGRPVAARVRTGHDRTNLWVQLENLVIEGVPDPLVEPIVKKLSRVNYTREEILDLASGALSPELAALLATHREALDLAFEEVVPSEENGALALDATFSIDERAAFGLVRDRFAARTGEDATAIAAILGPAQAQAQGLGDLLKDLTDKAEEAIREGVREGEGVEDIARRLIQLGDCRTAF